MAQAAAPTVTPPAASASTLLSTPPVLPPQILSRQPAPGVEAVLEPSIDLVFDQPMDPANTQNAFQLSGPDAKTLSGQFSWPDPTHLHFKPVQPLIPGTLYQVTLSEKAVSKGGAALNIPYTFRFSTLTPLQISQVFPAQNTTEVEANTRVTVMFNRPVVALGIAEDQKKLVQPLHITPEVSGQGEWINTSVYVFQPDQPLKTNTKYTVTVKASLQDSTGIPAAALPKDFTWTFTTLPPSVEGLEIGSRAMDPNDPYSGKDIPLIPTITLTFRQTMDPAATLQALTLKGPNAQPVPLRPVWNKTNDILTLKPAQFLLPGKQYTLSLSQAAKAKDGGLLDKPLQAVFTTVANPAVTSTYPGEGDLSTNWQFSITFAAPMNLKSIVSRITFKPELKLENNYWYNDQDHSLVIYGLKPSTRYEVTLQPGILDLYGNAINTGKTVHFTTTASSPYINLLMPYESVTRALGDQSFTIRYTNIKTARFRLYHLTPQEYISSREHYVVFDQFQMDESKLFWQTAETSTAKENEEVQKSIKMTGKNNSPLPPGFYFLGLDSPDITHTGQFLDGRYLVVASANLTLKTSSNDALLWVTGFEDGKPINGVKLQVVDASYNKLAEGVTDTNGLLHLDLPAATDNYAARYAISQDEKTLVFAGSNWGSGVSPEDFGIWEQYYGPSNYPNVYIYTDRPIYRPGQPVYFKGLIRMEDDLKYSLPDAKEIQVIIRSFDKEVYNKTLPLSSFGSFNDEFKLDQDAALGSYTISARLGSATIDLGNLSFTVAEYRKPEFLVDVSTDSVHLLGGQSFNAGVSAQYYAGGGVANAEVSWTLRSDPFFFKPPEGFSGYSFIDSEDDLPFYALGPNNNPTQIVAEGKGVTDENGKFVIHQVADISKEKTSQNLTLEVTVTDFSGFAVSGRTQITAHRSQVYPGIRPKVYIGIAGQEQVLELAALDWNGKPVSNQKVDVTITERRWYSVQEQDAQGNLKWNSTVKEIPVTTLRNISIGPDGKANASFMPPNGGVFRARITAIDKNGNLAAASTFLWVAGKEYIPWRQTNDRAFQLIADRESYKPGDSAEILIASPFQGSSYALVTLERGRIRSQEVILLTSNSTVYKLAITPDMAPVVYVSVTVVKGIDSTNPRPNYKVGLVKLNVSTDQQALSVKITPDKKQAGPGDTVQYTVQTTTQGGKPVKAEVSLGLSDLATLSLVDPNSVPILDYFYSPRSLSVRTAVSLTMSIEEFNAMLREAGAPPAGAGAGSGGGKGSGVLGVPEVRENFPDTAFWKADVLTDENGSAQVTVKLPDNLTTWRMDARAATDDTRVGQTTDDLSSTKPLLVRPQTPRFFVAGDQAMLGAAVHNNTGQDLKVEVNLDAQGLTLDTPALQTVEIKSNQQAFVSWNVRVPNTSQRADLIFSAKGGTFSDASRPTLGTLDQNGIPIYRYEVPEIVGTAGELLKSGVRTESIRLPQDFPVQQGDLNLKIEPSLAAAMTSGLDYLTHYPYECAEQTVSRFLPNVLTTQAMKAGGVNDPTLEENLRTQVNIGLQKLYNQQNSDGGWGWWRGSDSQATTSAYVVMGMAEAKKAGYSLDANSLALGITYLKNQVITLAGDKEFFAQGGRNRQAFILYVLARAGEADVSHTVQLYDHWQELDLYARGFLAQTLAMIDAKDSRLANLRSDLINKAILSATGTHWQEKQADPWNWNTDTRTTAILLDTLIKIDPQNAANANAVRWLMVNRSSGSWKSTQETAWALMSLTDWMVQSGELNAEYSYAVTLNGKQLGDGKISPQNVRQVKELQVSIQDLLTKSANALVIARDGDAGRLYYTSHLKVYLPVEQIKALDQGITISRRYYTLKDSKNPITTATQGDVLQARLTIVVPNNTHYLLVEDALPAGMEAMDTSLKTSEQNIPQDTFDWSKVNETGWGWWYWKHVELRDEKVVLSTDTLPAGTYVYTYLVRASTPGTFSVIPPTAQEFYFPEVYGRGDGSQFVVKP